MKKLIFINIVLFSFAFTNSKDSTNFKYTIYPELVGLGGAPSINIEYNINDYSLSRDWNGYYAGNYSPYRYI